MKTTRVGKRNAVAANARAAAVYLWLFVVVTAVGTAPAGAQSTASDGVGALADEVTAQGVAGTALDAGLQEYRVAVTETVARGGVVTVRVVGAGIATVQGRIVLADGFAVESHGWRAAGGNEDVWYVLFGIPSTAVAGDAEVRIAASPAALHGNDDETRAASYIYSRTVTVGDRAFRRETIPLNGSLTAIRADPDPRKVEESQILWALLNTTDVDARFHVGRFRMPVEEFRYTSRFGDRRTYAYSDGGTAGAIHNGEDLAAPTGTPIVAPARGRVTMATDRIVTGGTVVIEHLPGVYSLYYHLSSIDVSVGDHVATGQRIGAVGSTGLSTGPHLHWEIRVAGVAVDPKLFVERPRLDINAVRGALSTAP